MPTTNRRRRPGRLALAAVLVLLSPLGAVAAPATATPVLAASGAQVSGTTTYTIDPTKRVVHAHVVLKVKNTTPDLLSTSGSTRYYYREWGIGVQDEARHVHASRNGTTARVSVQQKKGYKLVIVTISPVIFFGSTATLAIDFDLPDGGARSTSQVRVGAAFATFVAYAFGDDKATVRIVVPAGYIVSTEGDPIVSHSDATGTVLTTDGSVDDIKWYTVVTADRSTALRLQSLHLPIDGQDEIVEVRSWPEDETWSATVSRELTRGLPELGRLIGLAWPVSGPLEVQEAYTPLLGGYAGFYIQNGAGALDLIRVTEDPDRFVILHEASHAWFNTDLFQGRWINEGLANQYASLAQDAIDLTPSSPDPVARTSSAAFALDSWPPPGYDVRAGSADREAYGYAASWMIARALYGEIGAQRMRDVFAAAAAHETPYVGRPKAETRSARTMPDWRYLLDLLEQRGRSDTAAGLFRTWVIIDADRVVLDEHERLRAAYATLVARGGDWLPGLAIRAPLERWDLAPAQHQIDEAGQVLDLRAKTAPLEAGLGVSDGGVLQNLYEAAAISYDDSLGAAKDELATLEALSSADADVKADRGFLVQIGLWGADPVAGLAAADDAYRAGRRDEAQNKAERVAALIAGAEGAGTQRVAAGAGGAGLVLISGAGVMLILRRRRRVPAIPIIEATPESGEAPATLAARTAGPDAAPEPTSGSGEGEEQR